MAKPKHEFHLVNPSPYPIITTVSMLVVAIGAIMFMHEKPHGNVIFYLGMMMIIASAFGWWREVIREGIHDKAHTKVVQTGLRIGMVLFIVSEVMFFFAFFFSFFKSGLDPVGILDADGIWVTEQGTWPPAGIETLSAWDLPFINTLVLLLSGTTVTWAHHSLLKGNRKGQIQGLFLTVFLGICFTILQVVEYGHATFGFSEGVYSSNFYMATGFHGFHVIIGTIFLAVCLVRSIRNTLTPQHHLGFEFAAWYWHFVDIVWLFLFVWVYIWGA